jgi:pimeloyl-ACP methyl ester carboxylesterase
MGAAIALRFALAHPERVRGLALAAFPPAADERRQRAWALDFAEAIEREGLEAAGARHAWGPESGLDAAAARMVKAGFLEHAPHAIAHTLRGVLAVQPAVEALGPALARLDVPALVLVGSEDRVSRRPSGALARALPRARLEIVEGAGHVVNLEARERTSAALRALLERAEDAP